MDGADMPCYILWPMHGKVICGFMAPVGIEHFFEAFSLDPKRPWRTAACQALGLQEGSILEDTHIYQLEDGKFDLAPRCIPVEKWSIAEDRTGDVAMPAGGESDSGAESGWSGISDNSSTDSEGSLLEASSVASDQDRFDTAYEAFQDLSNELYHINTSRPARGVTSDDAPGVLLQNGPQQLKELVHFPRNWPLARLTIPLGGLSRQVDRLLEGFCFQILATHNHPEVHNGKVIKTASYLTVMLAEYLADTIAWLMRSILEQLQDPI